MTTSRHRRRAERVLLVAIVILGVAGLAAFYAAGALLKGYYIPSPAMAPALLVGDRLLVDRAAYGGGAIPERGDIVTFPADGGVTYIKRVIGLPGDRIALVDGVVIIDGRAVGHNSAGRLHLPIDPNMPCDGELASFAVRSAAGSICALPIVRETLPGGASYLTIDLGSREFDDVAEVTLPPASVYVLGDNRDESADSRVPKDLFGLGGPIPIASISGRAEKITYSMDGAYHFRSGRAGLSLRPEHAP